MSHHHPRDSSQNLKVAFFLNLSFTLIEIAGGLWTNSIAILSDAVHDFGDSLSLGLAWYFERISKGQPTPRLTYGFRRYRLLGGLITGLLLVSGLGFVLWHAVERLFNPGSVRVPGMIALAVLGILVNGAAALRVSRGRSLTEKVVSWHLLEDTLGWVAVLAGAGIMLIWDAPIVDPLLSIGISLFVIWNVAANLRKVKAVFLQETPRDFDLDQFKARILEIPGVAALHAVHSWTIDGESHVISAHIVRDDSPVSNATLRRQVRSLLDPDFFQHITLEIEESGDGCPQAPEPAADARKSED